MLCTVAKLTVLGGSYVKFCAQKSHSPGRFLIKVQVRVLVFKPSLFTLNVTLRTLCDVGHKISMFLNFTSLIDTINYTRKSRCSWPSL
jgi:hypothetical protein